MTSYDNLRFTCVHCGESSEQLVLESTNAFGSPDLDLRPPEMQRSTMDAWLQECPYCRYVASDISQLEGDLTLVGKPEYTGLLNSPRFPDLARRFLAHALLIIKSDEVGASQSRLHAAWVCDDAELTEQANECRSLVANCLASLRPFEDSEDGVTQGAVLVDVLRRSEQFDQAISECDAVLQLQSARDFPRQVLEFQRGLSVMRDSSTHTLNEVAGN